MDLIDNDLIEHLSDEDFLLKNNFILLSTTEERIWVAKQSQYFKVDAYQKKTEIGETIRLTLKSSRFEVGPFQLQEANFERVKTTSINGFNIGSKQPGLFQKKSNSLPKRYEISDFNLVTSNMEQKLIELIPMHLELTIVENMIKVYAYLLNEPREKLILITELIELF